MRDEDRYANSSAPRLCRSPGMRFVKPNAVGVDDLILLRRFVQHLRNALGVYSFVTYHLIM